MNLTLRIWKQKNRNAEGRFVDYPTADIPDECSFLEMLDILNERLEQKGEEPVAFDHDCREGICGMCSLVINGFPHGPNRATTTCQLHMRHFKDGETITIEPFRAEPFPVLRDLIVDRSAFDRIQQAGGFATARTGSSVDANGILIPKTKADKAMEAAACIGCGACVAACPNASAMLFVGAKVTHFANLPQGQPERDRRVIGMIEQMDKEGFGGCTNHYECEAVCPAEIKSDVMAQLNRDYNGAKLRQAIAG